MPGAIAIGPRQSASRTRSSRPAAPNHVHSNAGEQRCSRTSAERPYAAPICSVRQQISDRPRRRSRGRATSAERNQRDCRACTRPAAGSSRQHACRGDQRGGRASSSQRREVSRPPTRHSASVKSSPLFRGREHRTTAPRATDARAGGVQFQFRRLAEQRSDA